MNEGLNEFIAEFEGSPQRIFSLILKLLLPQKILSLKFLHFLAKAL